MPHNPGMSEKAWQKFHALLARLTLKYSDKIVEKKAADNQKVS